MAEDDRLEGGLAPGAGHQSEGRAEEMTAEKATDGTTVVTEVDATIDEIPATAIGAWMIAVPELKLRRRQSGSSIGFQQLVERSHPGVMQSCRHCRPGQHLPRTPMNRILRNLYRSLQNLKRGK